MFCVVVADPSEIDYTAVGTSVATVFKPDRVGKRYVIDASVDILGYCIRGMHPSIH